MEFAEDHAAAEFIIHSCSAEGVRVNGQDLTESFMLLPRPAGAGVAGCRWRAIEIRTFLNGNRLPA